jgi:hypothetical protein
MDIAIAAHNARRRTVFFFMAADLFALCERFRLRRGPFRPLLPFAGPRPVFRIRYCTLRSRQWRMLVRLFVPLGLTGARIVVEPVPDPPLTVT